MFVYCFSADQWFIVCYVILIGWLCVLCACAYLNYINWCLVIINCYFRANTIITIFLDNTYNLIRHEVFIIYLYRYWYLRTNFIRCEKPFNDLFLTNVNQSKSRNDFFTREKTVSSNQRESVLTYQRIRSRPAKFSARIFSSCMPAIFSGLRRLPTVQPIFGHLGNTSALINLSYFFQLDMKI